MIYYSEQLFSDTFRFQTGARYPDQLWLFFQKRASSLALHTEAPWLAALRVGSVQPACSCCAPESVRTARQIPQCRSVVRSSRFRRVTYAQRKQLLFLYPLFPVRPASIKALVRTTAIWGLSYTNLNHAGLIGGQDSSASKSTLNSASKNSIVAGWLSSDASRVDSVRTPIDAAE